MKNTILTLSLFALCFSAWAVPARRYRKTITLSDGTQKAVVLKGDEYAHFFETDDGSVFVGDDTGGYQPAEYNTILETRQLRIQQRNSQREARRTRSKVSSTRTNTVGKKKGLVILANFSDRKLSISQSEFDDCFNKEGYANYGMFGSVHDYFWDCSYQQFDLTFDVVGPVDLSKSISYYGKNDSSGNDLHPGEMVGEAVRLADNFGVDFSNYDWDGDGYVDQVYVIYAGYGENSGAPSTTIWPHEWELSSTKQNGDGNGSIKLDGVTIDTYACSNELYGTSGMTIDGIGIACHEFSHCLGIPDMYDTRGTSNPNFGMDSWDLMDYGCYGEDGYRPVGYTSYERWISGWLSPIELCEGCEINDMPSLDSSPIAYIIYNQAHKDEYYLLENRQQVGWNKSDLGHGLLILHVDYDKNAWIDNTVNNTSSHQRMTIIPADNSLKTTDASLAGDPWPGTSMNTALTNSTQPAAQLYNANIDGSKYLSKPLEDITENSNGLISFKFNGGVPIDVPQNLDAVDLTFNSFTATWSPVDGVDGYEIELIETKVSSNESTEDGVIDASNILLHEDFTGFNNGRSEGADGTKDVSSEMDKYTNSTGWSGFKLYTTPNNEVKVGSSSVKGYLTTPEISPTSSMTSIDITLRPYNVDNSSFLIRLLNESSNQQYISEEQTYSFLVKDIDEPFQLTFEAAKSSKCRFYVSELTIYDGDVHEQNKVQSSIQSIGLFTPVKRANSVTNYTTDKCSYTFKDLEITSTYAYRVRAILGNNKSSWSDNFNVILPSIPEESDISNITLSTPNKTIYNINALSLPDLPKSKGVYIIDGKKILITK